jgi:glycosyltransferase involved in cell wall biosynthesis
MRILQFCNKSPYPSKEGGPIAMNTITEMLWQQGHSVKIVAVSTPKYKVDSLRMDDAYRQKTAFEWVWVDTRFRLSKALHSLLKNTSYHVDRFRSKALEQKLIDLLRRETFDVIIIETVYLAVYRDVIRKHSHAKLILRAHNVEHTIWEQIAQNTTVGLKKIYLSRLAKQLETFERNAIETFDKIWCISPCDKDWFAAQSKHVAVEAIPFGIDEDRIALQTSPVCLDNLFSLGSMDWYPNKEGLVWFLDTVWNAIHTRYPHLVFKIAGRNMPDSFYRIRQKGGEIVGEVADANQFMQDNGILIVPLWAGSGIRIKIIEAMSIGKVVITTTVGIKGIAATNREHFLLADTLDEFINAVAFCMENPKQSEQIGENARQLIQTQYNNRLIAEQLNRSLTDLR